MSYYPDMPEFDAAHPRDALPQPAVAPPPSREVDPELSVAESEAEYVVYAVETRRAPASSRPGTGHWEFRPFHEHVGGRAWKQHPCRVVSVPGLYTNSALVFTDVQVALRCAASLRDSRADRSEFRVIEVRLRRIVTVIDPAAHGSPKSWIDPEAQARPVSATLLTQPETLGAARRAEEAIRPLPAVPRPLPGDPRPGR